MAALGPQEAAKGKVSLVHPSLTINSNNARSSSTLQLRHCPHHAAQRPRIFHAQRCIARVSLLQRHRSALCRTYCTPSSHFIANTSSSPWQIGHLTRCVPTAIELLASVLHHPEGYVTPFYPFFSSANIF